MTDGERWAREALAGLRAESWRPAAVARFLVASSRRAAENRAARPALARQARTWTAVGALAWVLPAAAGVEPFRRRLRPGLAWWAVTALMLDWHLGMFETEAGEPRRLGAADACTLARAWLVPLAADRPAPLVCAAAFASDGLDGALARAAGPTRAGRDLEGAVDAAFSIAAVRGALRQGWIGRPPAALEAARVLAGAVWVSATYFRSAGPPDAALAHAARATTPLRAAALLAAGLGRRKAAGRLLTAGALAAWSAGLERRVAGLSRPVGPDQAAGARVVVVDVDPAEGVEGR